MNRKSFLYIFAATVSVMIIHQVFTTRSAAKAETQREVVEEKPLPKVASDKGKYYILENDYQQVVFSTTGGAVAEINLPFYSSNDTVSVVKPIGEDKKLAEYSKNNTLFPLKKATAYMGGTQVEKEPTLGGYTPLLRRGIVDKAPLDPKYYAFQVLSDDEDLSKIQYSVKEFSKNHIVFEGSDSLRKIRKTFRFPNKVSSSPYILECDIRAEGDTRGLYVTSGVPEVELVSGSYLPSIRYNVLNGKKNSVEKIKLPKHTTTVSSVKPSWLSNANGFFGVIIDPTDDNTAGIDAKFIEGEADPTRLTMIDAEYGKYPAKKYPGYLVSTPLKKGSGTTSFRIFAGPFETNILHTVDETYGTNYYAAKSIQGWYSFIAEPFAKFLYLIINLFHKATGSWGLSIILLTIVLRFMMFPLNSWSIKSSIRMQKVSPLVKKIQEKYKGDPRRLQMETLDLYKKHKANPFSGCLPMIIQLPFLFGMFELLKTTFQLRGATFIPGWITNLSAPDTLFSWTTPIPFFGTSFHILPFILGGLMLIQSKYMQMVTPNAGGSDDQAKQAKTMGYIMPVVMTFIFYSFPSGLNIYWISSSVLDILQRSFTYKRLSDKPFEVAKKVK